MFTKTELKVIRGSIKLQGIADKIAKKYGSCSRNYVGKVLKMKVPAKTKKAKAITNEFNKLLTVIIEEVD